MSKCVALLRGINVSGKNKIRMVDLKSMFESLGYSEVTTYLQSGNVVFASDSRKSPKAIASSLKSAIKQKFTYDVPVHVISYSELHRVFTKNPFIIKEEADPTHCYVTFLFEPFEAECFKNLSRPDNESGQFKGAGSEIYVCCPDGYGRTKINNQFFEKKLNVPATTRNWKTVTALCHLCKN